METNSDLLLWIMGGAGLTLMYAAYKKKSPLAVLTNHITNATTTTGKVGAAPAVNASAAPTVPAVPYSIGTDGTGTRYVFGGDGLPISVLPATSPYSIPSEY